MAMSITPPVAGAGGDAARRRAFATVLMIELWERFGFYGMAALMVLFMVQHLGFSDARANLTWGAASALIYVSMVFGGWLGDRWLGARRSMLYGAQALACGYLLLALPLSSDALLFPAIGLIAVGNGLFKPNAANLVRRIFEDDRSKLDSAFTIYYMAVNVGSTVSMLATPWVKVVWGWHAAFAVCCGGLVLGLLNYRLMRRALSWVRAGADDIALAPRRAMALLLGAGASTAAAAVLLQHAVIATATAFGAALAVVAIYAARMRASVPAERAGLAIAGVLGLESCAYFVLYQQMFTSLTLFALRNVDPALRFPWGLYLTLQPAQFQALNPIWIMALSPALAWLYLRLARGPGDLSQGGKFALGFAFVGAGFALLAASGGSAWHGRINPWLMVAAYGLTGLGELLIGGLGLAMVSRYVPARLSGFMMGAYFVLLGVAMNAGSLVANLAELPRGVEVGAEVSLPIYLALFKHLALLAGAVAFVALALVPWMRRMTRVHGGRNAPELEAQ